MASYLLQGDGFKIKLADVSGFILLDTSVVAPPVVPTHTMGDVIQRRFVPDDEDDAVAIALSLLM